MSVFAVKVISTKGVIAIAKDRSSIEKYIYVSEINLWGNEINCLSHKHCI